MFTYDPKGRIQSHTRTIAGRPFTLGYGGYDLLNRPTLLTYPNGDVVQMVYDREGEEQLKISSDFPVTSLVNQVSYTSQGQLRRLVRGGGMETLYHYYPWTGSPGNG
ncbi:MAG: hypothetical protein KJ063_25410, partial [Anaerolineae bacterium]|nr:hypothetical protein [Anaerolineae bacterium]